MTVPIELLYGIDVAIKKLRPYAKFEIYNTTITKWEDPTGSEPPTWEEISAKINEDEHAFQEWQNTVQGDIIGKSLT
jgi:hypothetical protein